MPLVDHATPSTLSPEAVLLLHGIKSNSLSVVEQTIRMFPRMVVKDFTLQGHAVWAYFQQEKFHAYRSNQHKFEHFLFDDKGDEPAALIVRSQLLAKEMVRVFGDPFTTAAYSDTIANDLDGKHFDDLKKDTEYRQGIADKTIEKQRYRHSRFDDPKSLVPPSVQNNPAWLTLFGTSGWSSSNFKNQLALNFLTLPHAKEHLDQWHETYGVHPIVQAISDANVDLVTMFLNIGVDPNLTVAVSRGEDRFEFPRSSLLSFVRDAPIANALLERGADPARAISHNRPINLFVHWRKAFGNNPRDTDLQRKMPELQKALGTHWNNPDAPIDQLIQSSGKGTGVEFKALLRTAGQAVAFQGRTILSEDTPEPTAYAAFLALNFPGKKQYYSQAKLLVEALKDKLDEPSPSGESWLFQTLTYLKPHTNSKDNKDLLPASFENLGKTIQASTAWKLTFPASIYAGGTRASAPPAREVHAIADLLTYLFKPNQPLRHATILEFAYPFSDARTAPKDWVSVALDFSGLTWRGPSGHGDATLSSYFSQLYHTHLSSKPDMEERNTHSLSAFASIFTPYFRFQRDSMVRAVFGTAYDDHITNLWPESRNRDGTVNRMNDIERQQLYKDYMRTQLNDPDALKTRLSSFTVDEQKAMVSFLMTRSNGQEVMSVMGSYGNRELDASACLALAILKSGVLPALNSEQLQNSLGEIRHPPIQSMFEAAVLDARQSERARLPSRRPSFDSAL